MNSCRNIRLLRKILFKCLLLLDLRRKTCFRSIWLCRTNILSLANFDSTQELRGYWKNSYENLVYQSVDDSSFSQMIYQKSTEKIWVIKG